ncbi:MAG: hypothetical protein HUU54_15325 [Ignavibacteriaceae bacterium]|nr:hypothetical protein [Ignavibacteriaceae bacterium]
MKQSFDFKVASVSTLVGILLVLLMAWLTGNDFGTPVFPFMAILSAYIISGMVIGLISKGETIAEPGVASILTGIVTFFVINAMGLHGLSKLTGETLNVNMLLLTLNGIIMTFGGAWAGEKLQGTFESQAKGEKLIEWGWILAGTIIGVTVSLLLSTLIIKFFSAYLTPLYLSLAIGIFVTGWIVGLRSPGVTIKEAAIAGILTAVINLDIFKFTLDPDTTALTTLSVIGTLLLGLIAALIGGVAGEKMQAEKEE